MKVRKSQNNCIGGIWITGRITGREGTGCNNKNGKASVIKVAGAFFVGKWRCGMYPVSDAFLRTVRSNTRKYFWTGTIVTKGGMTYEFGAKEIVKGSGYISRQCCGSTEIELGTVYAAV